MSPWGEAPIEQVGWTSTRVRISVVSVTSRWPRPQRQPHQGVDDGACHERARDAAEHCKAGEHRQRHDLERRVRGCHKQTSMRGAEKSAPRGEMRKEECLATAQSNPTLQLPLGEAWPPLGPPHLLGALAKVRHQRGRRAVGGGARREREADGHEAARNAVLGHQREQRERDAAEDEAACDVEEVLTPLLGARRNLAGEGRCGAGMREGECEAPTLVRPRA